jgi:hypothetical protein
VRFFTPEEANETLAAVRPLVERLVAENRVLRSREAELRELREKVAGNGGGLDPGGAQRAQEDFEHAAASVSEAVEELTSLGVQVKDLDLGLVDFPARRPSDGATVLLCWRLGEETIRFWHGLDEGFAGRKPLPF